MIRRFPGPTIHTISVNRVPRAELEAQEMTPFSGWVAGRFLTRRGFGRLAQESYDERHEPVGDGALGPHRDDSRKGSEALSSCCESHAEILVARGSRIQVCNILRRSDLRQGREQIETRANERVESEIESVNALWLFWSDGEADWTPGVTVVGRSRSLILLPSRSPRPHRRGRIEIMMEDAARHRTRSEARHGLSSVRNQA